MSCATIDGGYTIDCNKDSLGGLARVRLIAKNNIESYTVGVDGIITGIKIKTGKMFYDFALVKSTSNFVNTYTSNPANGTFFYAQALTLVFNKIKAATSKTVHALATSSVVAIVEDRNGEVILLGKENGLDVSGGTMASGTAGADRNGYDLQFTGEEKDCSHVDPTIVATLLVAAV